jgi:anthranilate phosphoribosyltransferase
MATIIDYLKPLLQQENLSFEQARDLLDIVFQGEVPEPQIAAFLTAMQMKSLTPEVMLSKLKPVSIIW